MDYKKQSLERHRQTRGKLRIDSKMPIETTNDLSLAYTPGVAEVSRAIAAGEVEASEVTSAKRTVAVVTDGSAVLGLGDIGPVAALPVMEGKAALFKTFAGIDAFPIAVNTQNSEEFIATVEHIAPSFGGINLEDISAPRCFEIEDRLKQSLAIPVFHDDQHGTAIVTLAGLINAARVTNKNITDLKVVMVGAGAAGVAIAKILHQRGLRNIIMADSKGILSTKRDDLSSIKQAVLKITNPEDIDGSFTAALTGADVFIGVSKGDLLSSTDVDRMANDAIILAMANPTPEIDPATALEAGAKVVATGRSDYPNQLNNVLAFPGIFKGALDAGVRDITDDMKVAAAETLASLVKTPTPEKIIPSPFDRGVADAIAKAVADAA